MIGVVLVVLAVIVIVVAIVCQERNADRIEKYCKDYIKSNFYCVGLDHYFKPYKDIKDAIIGMEGRCKLGYYDSYTEEEKQFVLQQYKELNQKLKEMDDKYPLLKDVYDTMRNRKVNDQKVETLCFPKYPRD